MALKDNTQFAPEEKSVFEKMIAEVRQDCKPLVDVLRDDLRDDLLKYRDKDGTLQTHKIPQKLWIVAIVHQIEKIAKKSGWGLSQEHGMVYAFTGKHWKRVEDDALKRFLSLVAVAMKYYSPADAQTHTFGDNLLKQYLSAVPILIRNEDPNVVFINLQNGTYRIDGNGGRMVPHNADFGLTYVLPYEYNENAQCPMYLTYLDRVLPCVESQSVLQEFHGYVFARGLKLEKALVLHGGGANGKSVQFEITTALFGEQNISTKTLGDLVDRDSGNDNRAKLQDRLLNYGSELRGDQMDVDTFKRLVSGEPVMAREKYKTSFDLKNTCRFIFNANKLPRSVENTEAYFRRFLILPYLQTIPEKDRDPELHRKIINSELSGIFNWVIVGLKRLLANKKFTDCQASTDAVQAYKKETNSVLLFLEDEQLFPSLECTITTKSIYREYGEWCSDNGMRKLSASNFGKELKVNGIEDYRTNSERGYYIQRNA